MYGYVAADNGPIADFDLSGERYAVGHDAVTAYHVVVGDMHVSHNQVVAADDGLAPGGGAPADGDVFADFVVVADFGRRFFTDELQVLRGAGDRSGRMDLAAFADAGSVVDHGSGTDPTVVADHHIAGDVGERLHRYVLSEFRVGMDVCLVAYHVRLLFIFNDLGHHRGFAGERFADEGLAFDYGYASSDGLQQLNFEMKGVARNHLALEFYAVDLHEISRVVLRIRNTA